MASDGEERSLDFVRQIVSNDLAGGKFARSITRFPPHPNGYLHIGHAKSICLNFGIAEEMGGVCHLRFDDTNPVSEDPRFIASMQEDIRWLGFDWGEHLYHASDYFEILYEHACTLIRKDLAFVCDLSAAENFERRGSLTEPGRPSPYRDRSTEENLELFARMKAGEFEPETRVLRARIDMGSSVLPMRDPTLYRILDTPHHRTGRAWSIYPMYDFAHSLSDAIEQITHSICTLEFQDRRPLYDWILEAVGIPEPRPHQYEFAELNLSQTILSKRFLGQLVEEGVVAGWDDPRMPTLSGLRRRGYTPESIRAFCDGIGVARRDSTIQLERLHFEIREHLNQVAPRAMGVLRPLKLVLENYPEDREEELPALNNPQDPAAGTRLVPFSRELWIERDDFLENPPKKFHRLSPGKEVRLRYAYLVTCTEVVKDADGQVVEVRARYDPATRGGDAPDGRKVRGTIHWVSARHAVRAEVRLYEPLFDDKDPMGAAEDGDFMKLLRPDSLEVVEPVWLEPSLSDAPPGLHLQLERLGYFAVDPDSTPARRVLNRTVTLRDSWAKIAQPKAKG